MEAVVLHRVGFLAYFCPKQGQDFKPSAAPLYPNMGQVPPPSPRADAIESIQRRALRIIFPNSSYQQALDLTNLSTLANRRILLCKKLMADMRDESHPISFLAPKVTTRNISYQLRSGNTTAPKTMKRTKRANYFFTFRFA